MKKIPLHYAILMGMAGGALFGYLFPAYVPWVSPLGTLFLKVLKLLVVPLIFVAIVDGIARAGNLEKLSRLGGRTLAYYMVTTAFAVVTSLVLVNVIRPGEGVSFFGEKPDILEKSSISFMDFIPDNVFTAFAEAQALQVIFIAIFFGIGLVVMGERVQGLRRGIGELNLLLLKLTSGVIALAPFGVFGLIADMVHAVDLAALKGVAKFALTILAGLFIHATVTLPVLFKIFSRRSLRRFLKNVQPAILTAFSTSSSSATLPVSLECVEEKEGIPAETSGFVLPVGATVNMDGTAMYEAVACLFIAQALGVELTLASQITVFLTATLAAIGAASIPSAGLITLAIVLTAVNLPLEGIGFLLAFDRPLDMCRTSVNVWGDMVGCAVLERQDASKVNLSTESGKELL